MLGAEGPCVFSVSGVGVGAVIFDVGEEEVYAYFGSLLLESACDFKHYGNSAAAVVSSGHWLFAVCLVGVAVGPRACVVVGDEEDSFWCVGSDGGEDVGNRQFFAVESCGFAALYANGVGAVGFHFCHDEFFAFPVGVRAGDSEAEADLVGHSLKGAVGVEFGSGDGCRLIFFCVGLWRSGCGSGST